MFVVQKIEILVGLTKLKLISQLKKTISHTIQPKQIKQNSFIKMISPSALRLVTRTAATRDTAFQALLLRPAHISRVVAATGTPNHLVVRNQSSLALDQTVDNGKDNFSHKPLKALSTHDVLRIKQELMDVDKNFDGRLDADELKTLLRKHTGTFSDTEIVEMGELYYAAKAGGSVPFSNFIEAVDRVAAKSLAAEALTGNEISPMGIRKDNLEYCNLGKPHAYTDDQLDITLTHVEPEKFVDKAAYYSCRAVRTLFDIATGWRMDNIKVENTMNRVIYLETIAAVPGMVSQKDVPGENTLLLKEGIVSHEY